MPDVPRPPFRVAVIGHTGRGNYGHGLDLVWRDLPECQVVAVADPDERGRVAAAERLGGVTPYADYVEMLERERPTLVSVAPRWTDQHLAMVTAAAERGVHVYLEKPLCTTLEEADQMAKVCREHRVKVALAFQTRYSPVLQQVRQLIEAGEIGNLLELRGRGLDDHRGGGEDLAVLGCHVFNLMQVIAGDPIWCFGEILQDGERVTPSQIAPGAEGLGPLGGDQVQATYSMPDGVYAHYASRRNQKPDHGLRYGLHIIGSRGVTQIGIGFLPAAYMLKDPEWSPGKSGVDWQPITSQGVAQPEPLAGQTNHEGNVLACRDLIAAIVEDRQPEASLYSGRLALEMVAAVWESHRLNTPVHFPLTNRANPVTLLRP